MTRLLSNIALLALAIGLASAPVVAETPGQELLLFSGGVKPAVYTDFTQGVLPSSSYTYSGASLRTITDATGAITYVQNNLAQYSNTFNAGSWGSLGTATATANTITFTGIGIDSWANNSITGYVGNVLASVTVSSASAGTVGLRLVSGPGSSTTKTINLTTTPTVYYVVVSVTGNNPNIGFDNRVGQGGDGVAKTISVSNMSVAAVTYETTPRPGDQVITQAAAYYGPAFDFDPVTHAPLGLRIEEARTNIITGSGSIGGPAWTISGAIGTFANVATSPDGTTDASQVVVSGTGAYVYNSNTVTASTQYTASVYLKAGTKTSTTVWYTAGGFGIAGSVVVNLSNGTIGAPTATGGATGVNAGISNAGNGWYRVWVTANLLSTVTGFLVLGNDTPTGNYYAWGGQIELGSFPTSYIPTAAASVTRAADVVQAQGPLAITLGGTAGSLVVKTSDGQPSLTATLVSANGVVMLGKTSGNNATTALASTLNSPNTAVWTSKNDAGLAWGPAKGTVALNGVAANDNNARTPTAPFYFGSTSGASAFYNGHIASVAAYKRQLAMPQ